MVGLGGIGHSAVKFGKSFRLHVTIISTYLSEEKEARKRLRVNDFLLSTNPEQMKVFYFLMKYKLVNNVSEI